MGLDLVFCGLCVPRALPASFASAEQLVVELKEVEQIVSPHEAQVLAHLLAAQRIPPRFAGSFEQCRAEARASPVHNFLGRLCASAVSRPAAGINPPSTGQVAVWSSQQTNSRLRPSIKAAR